MRVVSVFPFRALRRLTRTSASLESLVARWTLARPVGAKLAKLIGAPSRVRVIGVIDQAMSGSVSGSSGSSMSGSSMSGSSMSSFDPFAALAEVRVNGQSFFVGASSAFVRELAQKRLYGPEELNAPRPLWIAEHALFAGVVAAAITDAKIPGEVWPVANAERVRANLNSPISQPTPPSSTSPSSTPPSSTSPSSKSPSSTPPSSTSPSSKSPSSTPPSSTSPSSMSSTPFPATSPSTSPRFVVDLALDIDGRPAPVLIRVWCPASIRVALPPPRPLPSWDLDLPIVVGACALHRDDIGRLQVRDVITIERGLALRVGDRAIALTAAPGAVEAKVASDYVRRDMALPDDAHLELTVTLGTTRLSLRQLSDLVPGSIVSLGRPLSGPFEVRAAGRLVGQGELVDVDGELGVRIVSLQE